MRSSLEKGRGMSRSGAKRRRDGGGLSVASHSRSMLDARLAKLRLVEVLVGRFRRAKMDRPRLGTVRTEAMVCAPITARLVVWRV
jgi:hypothetical protein